MVINKNTSCLNHRLFLSAGYQSQFEDPREQVLDPKEQVLDPREQVLDPKEQVLDPREQVLDPRELVWTFAKHKRSR